MLENILNFVQAHRSDVSDLLMNQKVYTMMDMLKKAGFEEYMKELPKKDFFNMTINIKDILEVPSDEVQQDIFELSMMVDVLLLMVSDKTGLDVTHVDSLSLINVFGSYEYIKLYLENQFNVSL